MSQGPMTFSVRTAAFEARVDNSSSTSTVSLFAGTEELAIDGSSIDELIGLLREAKKLQRRAKGSGSSSSSTGSAHPTST